MQDKFEIPRTLKRVLYGGMIIGLTIFILGLFVAPTRVWYNFLIADFYLLGLGLGAGVFIAIQYVSNAAWGTAYRRIPEAMVSILPYAGITTLVLIFGIHTLYEWSHESLVSADAILTGKQRWLNVPFFIGRLVFYVGGWLFLSRKIVSHSLSQDEDGKLQHTHYNSRYSAALLVFGGITFVFASFDLLMSLQPHWYSTVFGLITLSGMFLNTIASVTLVAVLMRWMGYTHIVTKDHLHDLGKFLMSFSVFWVYMWVSQHLLIWYSNIPEETSYYVFRHFGGWGSLSFLNVLLNWLIPFVILLPRSTKRNEKILLQVSIVIMVGHWLDLFIMVMPTTFGAQPTFGVWEIGPVVGLIALFFWVTLRTLGNHPLIPRNDPYLVESLPAEEFHRQVREETASELA